MTSPGCDAVTNDATRSKFLKNLKIQGKPVKKIVWLKVSPPPVFTGGYYESMP